MADKKLRQQYEKRKNGGYIMLRLNPEEKTVLDSMMKSDGWENAAGFVKDKVFGNRVSIEYQKIIRKAEPADIQSLVQNFMDNLVKQLAYTNYCLEHELQEIKKNSDEGEDLNRKLVRRLGKYSQDVLDSTGRVIGDFEEVLRRLDLKVERRKVDDVELLPDSVIEHALDDWEKTQTPEAFEAVRRAFSKFNAQQQKILEERIRNEMKQKKNKE